MALCTTLSVVKCSCDNLSFVVVENVHESAPAVAQDKSLRSPTLLCSVERKECTHNVLFEPSLANIFACLHLRWANPRDSYRRIASEGYRRDSNH